MLARQNFWHLVFVTSTCVRRPTPCPPQPTPLGPSSDQVLDWPGCPRTHRRCALKDGRPRVSVRRLYSFTWDVVMDWGLKPVGCCSRHGKPCAPRERHMFRSRVYFVAVILDFLGRFVWTCVTFAPHVHPSAQVCAK